MSVDFRGKLCTLSEVGPFLLKHSKRGVFHQNWMYCHKLEKRATCSIRAQGGEGKKQGFYRNMKAEQSIPGHIPHREAGYKAGRSKHYNLSSPNLIGE